ncbi:MAG: glycosyltransferase family 2 protein [Merdibacter sp.]
MNKNYKVSLIMPVYNISSVLERSIDSVLNQTYRNIELVIVDDGSTDLSPKIIDQYAKSHSNVIPIHRKNGGVFSARIDGVNQASGEFIGFIDGDDYMEPEMIEQLIKNAIEYDADISHCGYQMVFPDDRVDYYYGTGKLIIQNNAKGLTDLLQGTFIEPGLWNKLYRRKLFDQVKLNDLDFSIKINEDLLLNYYLFKNSNCSVYEDNCYYHYIIRPNSAATSKINEHKLSDPLKVLKIMLEDNVQKDFCYDLIFARLVRQLITLATMSYKENPNLIFPYKKLALIELRGKIFSTVKCNCCTKKLKVMTICVALFPNVYSLIYFFYKKITGIEKKYAINS